MVLDRSIWSYGPGPYVEVKIFKKLITSIRNSFAPLWLCGVLLLVSGSPWHAWRLVMTSGMKPKSLTRWQIKPSTLAQRSNSDDQKQKKFGNFQSWWRNHSHRGCQMHTATFEWARSRPTAQEVTHGPKENCSFKLYVLVSYINLGGTP